MHNFCPFCKNPLTPWHQWKAVDGRFYCNEFCADASDSGPGFVPNVSETRDYTGQRTG
jgi:hypothetical protein